MKIVNEMMNDKWIGIEEAAEYLGVKPITVRDWIKKDTGLVLPYKYRHKKLNGL